MAPGNESEEEQKPQKHALDANIRRSTRIRRSRLKPAEPINVQDTKFKRGKRWTIQEKQLLLRALKERGPGSQFDYTAIRREVKTRKRAEVQSYLMNLRKRAIRYKIDAVKRQSPIEIWNALMKDAGDPEQECVRVMSKTMAMAGMELTTFPDRLTMDDFKPIKIYRYLASLMNGRDLPQLSPLECQIILDCFENLLEVLKGNEIKEQAAFLKSQYFKLYEKAYIGDWAFRQERILDVYAPNQSESGNSKSGQSGSGSNQVGNSNGSGTRRATEEERCGRDNFHRVQEALLLNPLLLPVELLDFKPLELSNKKKADDTGIATSSEEENEEDGGGGGGSDEMAMENDIEKPSVNESNGHADDGSLPDILELQNESPQQDCQNKNGTAADLSTRHQLENALEKVSESGTSNQGTEHVSSLQPPLLTIPAPVPDDIIPNATPRSSKIIDVIPCGQTISVGSQSGTSILAGTQSCSILQVKTPNKKEIIDNSVTKYPERSNVPGEDGVKSNVNSKGPRKTKLKLHRAKEKKVPKQRETVVDLLKKLRSDSLQSVNPFVPGSIVDPVAGALTASTLGSTAGPVPGAVAGPVPGAVAGPVPGAVAGPVPGAVAGAVAGQLLTLDLSQLGPHSNIVIPSSVLSGGIITIRSPENTASALPGIGATPTNFQVQGITMLGKKSATGCLQASPVVASTAPATQTHKAMASITKSASGIQPNQTGNFSSFTTQSESCMPPDVSNIQKNPVSTSRMQSPTDSYQQVDPLDVSSSLVVQSQHPDPSLSRTIASGLQTSQSVGSPSVTSQPTCSIPLGNQASTSVAAPSEVVQSKRRSAHGPVKLACTPSKKKSKSRPAVHQEEHEEESTRAGSGSGNSSGTECQSGSQGKRLPLFFSLKKK